MRLTFLQTLAPWREQNQSDLNRDFRTVPVLFYKNTFYFDFVLVAAVFYHPQMKMEWYQCGLVNHKASCGGRSLGCTWLHSVWRTLISSGSEWCSSIPVRVYDGFYMKLTNQLQGAKQAKNYFYMFILFNVSLIDHFKHLNSLKYEHLS